MTIHTPDQRLRVFVSSTLKELAEERKVVRQAILKLRLAPVMFESGARPHPAQDLYQSYLSQSHVFIGIYWQSYGWVGPNMSISGLEDEYIRSAKLPRLIYIKNPAPNREPALAGLLEHIRTDNTSSYTYFSTPAELKELVQNDLALMLTERFEAIQSGEPSSGAATRHPPTNVPAPRSPLIDRQQELAALRELLLGDNAALITLTGTGGAGKSRLALQIGIEMLDQFEDGVYLVKLETLSDPNRVLPTIAETLGIHEVSGSQPVDRMLVDFLRDKKMLLLLDNFEQIVEAAPEVAGLLEACPRLKIIATSRTPLRLRAEKEFPVPPLAVPALEKPADPARLSQYPAVELFLQRAQSIKRDFTVTNANSPAVAEICYRLDGLPLAIELAASRIKLLTPQELLARLGHRFDLLRGGTRDLPERQRALRGAIDWSYNLLNEPEKKLFRRLSIFIGGWTLEAAAAICSLDGDLAQILEDTLESLIASSLVIQARETEEESRFGMLATIREYARERFGESQEEDAIHRQHARYYLNFVKTVEPRIRSAERVRWQRALRTEFENVREVLEWTSRTCEGLEIAQQIIINFGLLWVTSGYPTEGQKWCIQILARSDESMPLTTRAELLNIEGWIAMAQGRLSSAQGSMDESLEIFQNLIPKTMNDKHAFAKSLIMRGMLAITYRDLATAREMLQRSNELFEETQDRWYQALALSWLGDLALYENNNARAADLHDQSLKLARQQGDPWCLIPPLMSLGQVALMEGDLTRAREILFEAEDLERKTGDSWSLTWALNDLGHISLMDGQLDQASAYFQEGLTLANILGNRMALLILLTGSAALLTRRSQALAETEPHDSAHLNLAARLCGATARYGDEPGVFIWQDSKLLYDADLAQVHSMMKPGAWDQAYTEGQSTPLDQAIALAIRALEE